MVCILLHHIAPDLIMGPRVAIVRSLSKLNQYRYFLFSSRLTQIE